MNFITPQFFFRALVTDLPLDEIVDELRDFDDRFKIILKKHIALLGWWCVLNLAAGIPGMVFLDGWIWYFFLMNMTWAAINFLIVVWIYDHIYFLKFAEGSTFERFEVQRHVEKMLLLNIGLDAAYIFAGLYLLTLGRVPEISHQAMWTGFGWSVILQGAFLFCHDNFFHLLHRRNFRKCRPFLEDLMESQLAQRSGQAAVRSY